MARRPVIPFFTDQNVPDSVGNMLIEAGHEVTRLREVMATDSPDTIVAAACDRAGLVLVTFDRDFKHMAPGMGIARARFNALSIIRLGCREPVAAERLRGALSFVELEWRLAKRARAQMVLSIADNVIRSHR
jgi:predicted nuclease of predicted toxin-antitoxin system